MTRQQLDAARAAFDAGWEERCRKLLQAHEREIAARMTSVGLPTANVCVDAAIAELGSFVWETLEQLTEATKAAA
jgi:hypothetical protein